MKSKELIGLLIGTMLLVITFLASSCAELTSELRTEKTQLRDPVSLKAGQPAPFDCKCIDNKGVKTLFHESTR